MAWKGRRRSSRFICRVRRRRVHSRGDRLRACGRGAVAGERGLRPAFGVHHAAAGGTGPPPSRSRSAAARSAIALPSIAMAHRWKPALSGERDACRPADGYDHPAHAGQRLEDDRDHRHAAGDPAAIEGDAADAVLQRHRRLPRRLGRAGARSVRAPDHDPRSADAYRRDRKSLGTGGHRARIVGLHADLYRPASATSSCWDRTAAADRSIAIPTAASSRSAASCRR